MIYNNPLWDYALKLYRQAGVEDICLSLQAQGVQINLCFSRAGWPTSANPFLAL
ncbi:hypothetical protein D791_02554 [Nitrincola nitratireducens]|uniref:Uncharacterized protein n=1 Tax=Nitrincola nitratireducens TaxID=1229521 RepID=W9UTS9_9GAMM|nr:hypothetical protein D791_02554 [Nitrincola nitratireducens]